MTRSFEPSSTRLHVWGWRESSILRGRVRDPGLRDRGAEIQVGVFVLISLIALVVGIFWISNTRFGGPALRLHGVASEAGQITSDAKVFLIGVEVGEVGLVQLEGLRVLLRLDVYEDVELPADTRGVIRPAGFLGSQMVELVPGVSDRFLASGDTIPIGRTADLQSLAAGLGDETEVILDRIQDILSETMVSQVREGSEAFAAAMSELSELLRDERETLGTLLQSLEATGARVAELVSGPELDRTVASIDSLTGRLAAASSAFDSTSHAVASITARLDAGEGSLGKMLADDELYDALTESIANLQAASEEVALLAKDVRERPERYLKDIKISVF